MNAKGQYFASVLVEDGKDTPEPNADGKAIGIDLGLNHFAITSDGSKFSSPRWYAKHENNLKHKQKRLSRRHKRSNNRNKTRRQVASVHHGTTHHPYGTIDGCGHECSVLHLCSKWAGGRYRCRIS
jgi:putative transposase